MNDFPELPSWELGAASLPLPHTTATPNSLKKKSGGEAEVAVGAGTEGGYLTLALPGSLCWPLGGSGRPGRR